MAKIVINSVTLKKLPKAPKINASKATWDAYEKRKKEFLSYNESSVKEKARRLAIKAKR